MKKRILALLLTIGLLVGLCGCGEQPAQSAGTAPSNSLSSAQETSAPEPETPAEIPEKYHWDLTAIYADNAAFEKELQVFEKELLPVLTVYRGELNTEENILAFMQERDKVEQIGRKLYVYASCLSEQNQADSAATAAYQKASKALETLRGTIAFAGPELLANSDTFLDKLLQKPEMQPFETQLSRMRTQAKYVLPPEEENLLLPLDSAATGAFSLFSKLTAADMVFTTIKDPAGKDILIDEAAANQIAFTHSDREFRKSSTTALYGAYGQYRNTFAQNMDNFLQATVSSAHGHHYQSAKESSLAENDVPIEVYDNLIIAANNNLSAAHRNAELRKKILGAEELYSSDMNYPLVKDLEMTFSYEGAQKLIIEALAPLGSEYQVNLKKAFDERWIDVYPSEGKSSGAFSAGLYGVHPFILTNYTDDFYSLTTLAHELGHAMHQYQSEQTQKSDFTSAPSSFTSEVASVTNELLLSDYMIKNAKSDDEKLYFLFLELSTMRNSFFMQTMFAEYEDAIYQIVEDGGSVTADTLEQRWREIVTKYDGPSMAPMENVQFGWSRVPHFYYDHYVYQYATSIAAASSIAKRITVGEAGAVEAYQKFLCAGDSGNAVEIIKLAGVDITSPDFAKEFISRYNGVMDQIEQLTSKK